jgi:hypothetical protein
MSDHVTDDELQRRKRELRLRIARLRRRIDGRIRHAETHTRQLLSWRTYAARYPGWALVAALGVGLTAAASLRSKRTSRRIGSRFVRQAWRQVLHHVWEEWKGVWTESTPDPSTTPTASPSSSGAADGRD